MKYLILSVLFFVVCWQVNAQEYSKKNPLTFTFGLGVNYGTSPEFTEFLRNEIPYSNPDSISYFNGSVEFFGALSYGLTKNFALKLDYSYLIRNLNYTYSVFVFDYTISSHQPFIFANYVYRSGNINLRFGLGAGYHFQSLTNKVSASVEHNYKSSGPAIRAEGSYHLALSRNFYGIFNIFGYSNFYSDLKDSDGNILKAANTSKTANLSGYGIGLRLGFGFIIN
jgi:hypothetical protein